MPKLIDSQALGPLQKTLGLAGVGAGETELLDGVVDQVIDVGPIVRRGRTLAGTEGIFRAVLRNQHLDIQTLATSWQPYESSTVGLVAPYPSPVPAGLDVWLLGATVERAAGAGSITDCNLQLTNVQLGFAQNDLGAAVTPTTVYHLAFWNSLNTTGSTPFALTETRLPYKTLNMRIPRKGAIASPFIVFESTSTATVHVDVLMLIGVFPSALGQDVIG